MNIDWLELVVRGIIICENFALVVLTLITTFFYVRRNYVVLLGKDYRLSLARRRAWHIILVGIGNAGLYTVFLLAIYANIGKGVTGWQIAFSVCFAVILLAVYFMMSYQIKAHKYGLGNIHETETETRTLLRESEDERQFNGSHRNDSVSGGQ